ncbi:MAG: hypothetical protein ACKO2C_05895 [Actinomycetes bacterium]
MTFDVAHAGTLISAGEASTLFQSTGSAPASSGSTPIPTSKVVGVSPPVGRDQVIRAYWGSAVDNEGWSRNATVAGAVGAVAPPASAARTMPAPATSVATPNRKNVALTCTLPPGLRPREITT